MRCRRRGCLRPGSRGQRELEAGARVGDLQQQRAAYALGELAPDREAEAEAALGARRATAVEALEDALALLLRHPGTAVGDLDDDAVAQPLGDDHDRVRLQ